MEQERREVVRCVTFEQWEHALRKRGFDFGPNGVTALLLEDAIKYLGRQRSQEIGLLSGIGPSTKLRELREFAGSTSIDGFRIAQVIRTGVYELSQEQPSVKITARFQAIPYYPRKELERRMPQAVFNQVMSLRATYRRELISVARKVKDLEFKSTNYYLQLGEVRVYLTLEDSLRTVAEALWDKAVVLADAMDGALEALDVGSTQRHQHPEHSDARFADLLT